jgi:hypothetical protein
MGPATFVPLVPKSRKQWKAMYTGTIKRLSRLLSTHAREVLKMDDGQLHAAADALPLHAKGNRGKVVRLVRKLDRLRSQKPGTGTSRA